MSKCLRSSGMWLHCQGGPVVRTPNMMLIKLGESIFRSWKEAKGKTHTVGGFPCFETNQHSETAKKQLLTSIQFDLLVHGTPEKKTPPPPPAPEWDKPCVAPEEAFSLRSCNA